MAEINIKITAPNPEFIIFANELGYQEQVSKTPAELALLIEPISIQDRLKVNPQTRDEYLLEYFKRITVNELSRVKIANIQRQVDSAKETEKVEMRTVISNAVAVTKV